MHVSVPAFADLLRSGCSRYEDTDTLVCWSSPTVDKFARIPSHVNRSILSPVRAQSSADRAGISVNMYGVKNHT
jgi:hypothetical protein